MNRLPFTAKGVIPAALLPFHEDCSIDFEEFRRHLSYLANVKGVTAICINGNVAQVQTLTPEEQRQCIEHAFDEVGGKVPLLVGINAEGSQRAAELAAMAEASGASGLLVFPPHFMYRGGHLRPEMALVHYKTIAAASKLPLVIFQFKVGSGLTYPIETVRRLCMEVPTIIGMKDSCGDPRLHEKHLRMFRSFDRHVSMLTTHSAWLLSSLALGCDGLISGSGSVLADIHAALFAAFEANDLVRARKISDRLFPIVDVFYGTPPLLDMHTRMKEALVYLGRMKRATVRPPLCPLSDAERERIYAAIEAVGLKKDGFEGLTY
ncbi:dihydrodipicolinate synthase family protein [uncultured Mailhella sp.]|uniref:dihydrodipicolinate synthase family protein n=1 Tax=uncultured Mailhella sp. TaxID=1981031 RepID=UPI0025E2642E|nr:dihydrodipicolinate synthase family protein [uncultured Mailhella sp.]